MRLRGLLSAMVRALLVVGCLAAAACLVNATPAAGEEPTPADPPSASATPMATVSPTDPATPTDPEQPTSPTATEPGSPPSRATSARPTPTPGGPTPTRAPSANPSPTPTTPIRVITLPPTPPASAGDAVPITSAIIAFVVLVLVGLLLRELTTGPATRPEPESRTGAAADPASEDDVLHLLSTAGDALVEAGFDVSDVQSDLRQIAAAHGMHQVEILALPTMLLVSGRSDTGLRTSAVATGDVQLRLHQIEALDDVVTGSQEGLDPREAAHRIDEIRATPSPFPPVAQLLGCVLATMGLAVLLGSSWPGMVVSGLLGVVTGVLGLLGQRVPQRYQALVTVTASTSVALVVFLLARLGWSTDIVPTLIAPLITLLPGALLTTGVTSWPAGT